VNHNEFSLFDVFIVTQRILFCKKIEKKATIVFVSIEKNRKIM